MDLEIKYYNYHEYVETRADGSQYIVTEFPNSYNKEPGSIVRIPRAFQIPTADIYESYPQFSTVLPGFEPGAFTEEGVMSISRLSQFIDAEEFTAILQTVNDILKAAFKPSWQSSFYTLLSFFTFWTVYIDSSKTVIDKRLKPYIDLINDRYKSRGLTFVSPVETAYLSVSNNLTNCKTGETFCGSCG